MAPTASVMVSHIEQLFASDSKGELEINFQPMKGREAVAVCVSLKGKKIAAGGGHSLLTAWSSLLQVPHMHEIAGPLRSQGNACRGLPAPEVTIIYTLSEKGRRQSLLGGGDGKHLQIVQVEATEELLQIATIHEDGVVVIYLTEALPRLALLSERANSEILTKVMSNFREGNRPCPRRKVKIELSDPDSTFERGRSVAKSVPLSCDTSPEAHLFDYDEPFTEEALVAYVLELEARNTADLIRMQQKVAQENEDERQRMEADKLAGRTRVAQWLAEPDVRLRIQQVPSPGRTSARVSFGEDLTEYILRDDDYRIAFQEEKRRLSESANLENLTQEATRQKELELVHQGRMAREMWIAEFGSDQLKKMLADGKAHDNVSLYHRERITKEVGPEWDWVALAPSDYTEVPVQNVPQPMANTVLDYRMRFPQANVRLRQIVPKNTSAIFITRVRASNSPYMIMNCPWDADLPNLATVLPISLSVAE